MKLPKTKRTSGACQHWEEGIWSVTRWPQSYSTWLSGPSLESSCCHMCLNCMVILATFPKMCMQSVHSGPGQPLALKREGIPALSGTTTKDYLYSSCTPWHLLYCIMLFMLFYVMLFMLFEAGMDVALCHLPPHSPMADVIFDHSVFPTEPRLDLNIFSTHTPGSHYQLANQMAVACDMKPVFHPNSDGQLSEGQEPCLLHLCNPYSTYPVSDTESNLD